MHLYFAQSGSIIRKQDKLKKTIRCINPLPILDVNSVIFFKFFKHLNI